MKEWCTTYDYKVGDGYRIHRRALGAHGETFVVGVTADGKWKSYNRTLNYRNKDGRMYAVDQRWLDKTFPMTRVVVRSKYAFELYSHQLEKSPMTFGSVALAEEYLRSIAH